VYAVLLSIEAVRDTIVSRPSSISPVYDQLVWLLAYGHEPFSTVISRPLLGGHFQPGIVLLTPIYWLDLGVPGLLTAQSIALALTAPALYALARASGASSVLAALPALLWLVCPFVASANLFEFRQDPFAVALIVVSVLAALQGRHALLVAAAVLALSPKEDIALTYVMLGLLLMVHGRRRLGVILALGSAAWYVAAISTMNALGSSNEAFARRFAGERGDSVGEAFLWMLEHPLQLLGDVAVDSLGDVLLLLLSTGSLALLAPSWLLLSLPTALHNALSAYGATRSRTSLPPRNSDGLLRRRGDRRRTPALSRATTAVPGLRAGLGRGDRGLRGGTLGAQRNDAIDTETGFRDRARTRTHPARRAGRGDLEPDRAPQSKSRGVLASGAVPLSGVGHLAHDR